MPKSEVIDIDHGWRRIASTLKWLRRSYTKVGFPQTGRAGAPRRKRGKMPQDMSGVVTVAAVHVFGAPKRNIPQRDFFRPSIDGAKKRIARLQTREYNKLLDGTITVREGLSVIGEYTTNVVKKGIRDLKLPPLAPSTLARKRSRYNDNNPNPLIDTGQMLQSVQHQEVIK